jgi:hypothetical protein
MDGGAPLPVLLATRWSTSRGRPTAPLATPASTGIAPLAALPGVLGVTGAGTSLLERHGFICVNGAGSAKLATLTPRGERVRDTHAATVAATEQDWHAHHGAHAAELARVLAEVDARLPDDLPDHVTVRYVGGRGFADVSSTE